MAIELKSTSTFGPVGNVNPSIGSSDTIIRAPEGLAVGDYIVVTATFQSLLGNNTDIVPAGFAKLNNAGTATGRLSATYGMYISDASMLAPLYTNGILLNAVGTPSTRVAAALAVFTGVDGSTPVAGASVTVETVTAGTSIAVPDTAGDFKITCIASNNGGNSGQPVYSTPAGVAYVRAVSLATADAVTASSTGVAILPGGSPVTAAPGWSNATMHTIGLNAKAAVPEPEPVKERKVPVSVASDSTILAADLKAVAHGGKLFEIEPPRYSVKGRVYTIDDLFASDPFYAAHRGSGGNWPEHSMVSYSNAANHGMKALEVSVVASSDGVLFCQHDQSMTRTTGVTGAASSLPWSTVKDLTITAAETDNPSQPRAPIVTLKEVLDRYAETHVIFLEDKQGTNAVTTLNMMDSYKDSTKHFIWKQWAGAGQYTAAANRGYKTWGYFQTSDFTNFDTWAPRFSYLGIHTGCTDDQFRRMQVYAEANSIPVICWEIHTDEQRRRAFSLGVQGMMTANIRNVLRTPFTP